ncbi:MAG: hypothetical protein ACFFAI_16240 [Promethearchaeota archaeon]
MKRSIKIILMVSFVSIIVIGLFPLQIRGASKTIRWYNFSSYPNDPNSWSTNYIKWMDQYSLTQQTTGKFPGNSLAVSFQPRRYAQGVSEYNLEFGLDIHVETNMGDDDKWPQPTMDDSCGFYYYPAPMAVQEVKITTTLLPLEDIYWWIFKVGKQSQQPKGNEIKFKGACQNTFLGTFSSKNEEMYNLVLNGDFSNGDQIWTKYGTSHGSIEYNSNYGYMWHGLKIVNNDGEKIGVKNLNCHDVYGAKKLYINYWGKRISSDTGTTVGVDLYVKFTDGTYMWLMPNELRMTHRDGYWHHYEYSFESSKTISYIRVYALNYEKGTAYFDQIYVTDGAWTLHKRGNWVTGNYDNTYNAWVQEMEAIESYNTALGVVGKAIKVAGLLSKLTGIGSSLSTGLSVGGFLLNALEQPVPSFSAKGKTDGKYSVSKSFDHTYGHTAKNGQFGFVLACDDSAFLLYDLDRNDLDSKTTRTVEIKIEVWWSYIGDSDWLNVCQGLDVADYASITFKIKCSKYQWSPPSSGGGGGGGGGGPIYFK